MKLSISLTTSTLLIQSSLRCIVNLLQQTSNIHSLAIRQGSNIREDSSSFDAIFSLIIRHVDSSKLRHLEIPIYNLNHIEMLLDRFRDLSSIRLFPQTGFLTSENVTTFVKSLTRGCSALNDNGSVSIWIGERLVKRPQY